MLFGSSFMNLRHLFVSRVWLPVLQMKGPVCLRFWYHMFGFHINELQALVRHSDDTEQQVFRIKGQQGTAWIPAALDLNLDSNAKVRSTIFGLRSTLLNWNKIYSCIVDKTSEFLHCSFLTFLLQIGFSAFRGDAFSGDIALDHIRVSQGPCWLSCVFRTPNKHQLSIASCGNDGPPALRIAWRTECVNTILLRQASSDSTREARSSMRAVQISESKPLRSTAYSRSHVAGLTRELQSLHPEKHAASGLVWKRPETHQSPSLPMWQNKFVTLLWE